MESKYLEVVLMDNGEVICLGKTVGYEKELDRFLFTKEQLKYIFKKEKEEEK